MMHSKLKLYIAGAALTAVAALAGCHDDHNNNTTTQPTPSSTDFNTFAIQVYGEGENTVPINYDNVTFTFVDDDPTAFNTLLM